MRASAVFTCGLLGFSGYLPSASGVTKNRAMWRRQQSWNFVQFFRLGLEASETNGWLYQCLVLAVPSVVFRGSPRKKGRRRHTANDCTAFQSALNGALQSRYTYLRPWILIMKVHESCERISTWLLHLGTGGGSWIVSLLRIVHSAQLSRPWFFSNFVSGGKS